MGDLSDVWFRVGVVAKGAGEDSYEVRLAPIIAWPRGVDVLIQVRRAFCDIHFEKTVSLDVRTIGSLIGWLVGLSKVLRKGKQIDGRSSDTDDAA